MTRVVAVNSHTHLESVGCRLGHLRVGAIHVIAQAEAVHQRGIDLVGLVRVGTPLSSGELDMRGAATVVRL